MNMNHLRISIVLKMCLILTTANWAQPIIAFDPDAYETDLFSGEAEEFGLVIINEGDGVLRFQIDHEILMEPERAIENRPGAPLRDDIGEVIREYEFDEREWRGIAYDGELIWGLDMGRQRIVGYDPEREDIVENINIDGEFIGLTWDGEAFWTCRWAGDNGRDAVIVRINMNGEIISTLRVRGDMPIAITYNGHNILYHSAQFQEERVIISEIDFEGEQVAETDITEIYGQFGLSLAWVADHEDGQLWMKAWGNGDLYQLNINGDEPDVIQQAELDLERSEISDLSHDGENLLYISDESSNIRVVDDGVQESSWLSYDTREGEVEPGDEIEIIITLDAEDLIEGDYEADLIISSNDRENPEAAVNILMHVTGIPELEAIWREGAGYPDVVDWNNAFRDLFVGFQYDIEVTIINSGTALLIVDDVSCEEEEFTTDNNEFALDPGESQELIFIFQSDQSSEFEADMIITWNSPDDEDFIIPLVAQSMEPPVITVDPMEIEFDLDGGGDMRESEIIVSNDGESNLRFFINHEIIAEPGDERDFDLRSVRVTDRTIGPVRDDAGDLLGEFRGIGGRDGAHFVMGWDWDNDRMWISNFQAGIASAISHDANYEEFDEEIRINPGNVFDGAWVDGLLYIFNFGNRSIIRYNEDGENIGAIQFQWSIIGIAADVEERLLLVMRGQDDNNSIHIYPLDDDGGLEDEIGVIDNHMEFRGEDQNERSYGFEWVPAHNDGHLWLTNHNTNEIYQVAVDTEEWTCTEGLQNFEVGGINAEISGVAHDGENLWISGYDNGNIRIYDDGVGELNWLAYEPTEGEIEEGEETSIIVMIDATGLIAGDYEADLHFLSNDPQDPVAVVNIRMHVGGFPRLLLSWDEDFGFPEIIDWNQAHEDLFTGGSYDVSIWLESNGTSPVIIEEITFDNELYSTEQQEIVIPPGDDEVIILTFNAEEDGEHQAQMIIHWDGMREEVISLIAISSGPPEIDLSTYQIEAGLEIGNVLDEVVAVSNDGVGTLRFYIEHEPIREPEAVRNLQPTGPERDDFGDVIDQFQMGRANWTGLAWDGILMWGMDPERQQMVALNPRTNQVEHRINLNSGYRGMAYDGEAFWVGYTNMEDGGTNLRRLNREGEVIATIDLGEEEVIGVAFDGENLLYHSDVWRNDEIIIHQITPDGERLREYTLSNIIDEEATRLVITWVGNHREGKLWAASWQNRTLYQIDVSGDELRVIQQTELNQSIEMGIDHDGTNMWYSTSTGVWYVIDDGITEASWLTYEPESGELEAGAELDVIISLNAEDLIEGSYEADMHFYSNDIVDEDVILSVVLEVSAEGVNEEIILPVKFNLADAFPNPFNSSTKLRYDVPVKANVSIIIYDIAGHQVATLTNSEHSAGSYVAVWNGQFQASGIYFVRMVSQNFSSIKRVALVR